MRRTSLWHPCVVALVALVLLAACLGCATRPGNMAGDGPASEDGIERATPVDLIAYSGADGGLFTILPDGTGSRRLAGGGVEGAVGRISAQGLAPSALFTWPTWSPDGRRLAFSRVLPDDGSPTTSIHVVDLETQNVNLVHENGPGASPFIAQDASHYLYWAPDSSLLDIHLLHCYGSHSLLLRWRRQGGSYPHCHHGPHLLQLGRR